MPEPPPVEVADGEPVGDEVVGGVVGAAVVVDGAAVGLEVVVPPPHGPSSVQTSWPLSPGMSPWVHHFAVH
jgi:hypothetical protein